MSDEKQYQLGDMLKQFPIHDFCKMIEHIDRFDPDTIKTESKTETEIIKKSEELSDQIIEENL